MKNKIKPIKAYGLVYKDDYKFVGYNRNPSGFMIATFKDRKSAIGYSLSLKERKTKVIPVLITPLSITSKAK